MADLVIIAGTAYEVTDDGNGLVKMTNVKTDQTSQIPKESLDYMISHSPPSGLEGMGLQWTPDLGLTLKGGREATSAPATVGNLYLYRKKPEKPEPKE